MHTCIPNKDQINISFGVFFFFFFLHIEPSLEGHCGLK